MTPVGHSLLGASVALVVLPRDATPKRKFLTVLAFALIANIPDYKLPSWGHERYDISHSIYSNMAIWIPLFLVLVIWKRARIALGGFRILLAAPIAWMSHMILDSTYNHANGIAIFWPFNDRRLAMPIPWFEVLRYPLSWGQAPKVFGIEALVYGMVLLSVLVLRRITYACLKTSP